jgi:hypothetical protein
LAQCTKSTTSSANHRVTRLGYQDQQPHQRAIGGHQIDRQTQARLRAPLGVETARRRCTRARRRRRGGHRDRTLQGRGKTDTPQTTTRRPGVREAAASSEAARTAAMAACAQATTARRLRPQQPWASTVIPLAPAVAAAEDAFKSRRPRPLLSVARASWGRCSWRDPPRMTHRRATVSSNLWWRKTRIQGWSWRKRRRDHAALT